MRESHLERHAILANSLKTKKAPETRTFNVIEMVGLAGSQEFYEYSAISLILLRWLWDRERQVT
jgi:hypothetical protein